MKTRILLLDPQAAGGGGGGGAEMLTGDINLADPAFERLGLPASLRETPLANGAPKKEEITPGATSAGAGTETPEAKATREAAAAAAATAAAELQARAEAAGVTVEEQAAAEAAAATAETERLTAKAAELGLTVEAVQAQEAAEAAQNQPPAMDDTQRAYVEALVAEKDSEISSAQQAKEAAEAEAAALRTQLETTKRPPLAVMGVHPIMLAQTPQQIEEQDAQYAAFEKWAVENWDGSPVVEARGDQPAVPAFDAAQIRKRYQEIKELRTKLVPQARAALTARVQMTEAVKTVYPALFDSKRTESKVVTAMLGNYPELEAVIPNFHLVAGDALLGEALRKVLADPKNKCNAQAKNFLATVPELKGLINLPTAPAAGAASPRPLPALKGATPKAPGKAPRPSGSPAGRGTVPGKSTTPNVSAQNLSALKAGGLSERDALTEMIKGTNLPTLAQKE